MQDFYVTLPSNTPEKRNSTSNFRVRLPEEIQLTGGAWEVALVEIQFPCSWNNVTDEYEDGVTYNELIHSTLKQNEIEVELDSGHQICIQVKPGYYKGIKDLLNAIANELDNSRLLNEPPTDNPKEGVMLSSEPARFDLSYDLEFQHDEEYNKVYVHASIVSYGIRYIKLSQLLRYMLGFESAHLPGDTGKKVYAKYPPDMRAGIESLYIYADIVEPQLVGNKRAQVLRIVPISGSFGDIVDRSFDTPHYVPVLKKTFSTIEISIKTDQDKPFAFQFGKAVVKLHFRKRFSLRI